MRRNLTRSGFWIQLIGICASANLASAQPDLQLKRIILTFPPASTATSPTAATTPPAATAATNVVVNVPLVPTNRVMAQKDGAGNLLFTHADQALAISSPPPAGPTALLVYENDPKKDVKGFTIDVNPGATLDTIGIVFMDDNGVNTPGAVDQVELQGQPSRTLVDNNNNDPTTNTTGFIDVPKAGKLTIKIKPGIRGTLRVTVPDKSVVTSPVTYLIERANEYGNSYTLRRQITVMNGSPADWNVADAAQFVGFNSSGSVVVAGTLKSVQQSKNVGLVPDNKFSPLAHPQLPEFTFTRSYTVVENLDKISVDAKTAYVDLGSLLVAGKPSPNNVSRLPKVIKLENNSDTVVIPSGTQVQIRLVGSSAEATIGTATLSADLVPKLTQNQSEKLPSEYLASIAFLSFGIDSGLQIMGAQSKTSPWLPISVSSDGSTLSYLNADEWGFDSIPPTADFFDSRSGYLAVVIKNPTPTKTPYVWSVSTSVVSVPNPSSTTPADDLSTAITGLSATKKVFDFVISKSPNPLGTNYSDIIPHLDLIYRLDTSRVKLPSQNVSQSSAPKLLGVDDTLKSGLFTDPVTTAQKNYTTANKTLTDLNSSVAKKQQILKDLTPYAGRNRAGVSYSRLSHELQDLQFQVPSTRDEVHATQHEYLHAVDQALLALSKLTQPPQSQ